MSVAVVGVVGYVVGMRENKDIFSRSKVGVR